MGERRGREAWRESEREKEGGRKKERGVKNIIWHIFIPFLL